jgi:hypothetical protein
MEPAPDESFYAVCTRVLLDAVILAAVLFGKPMPFPKVMEPNSSPPFRYNGVPERSVHRGLPGQSARARW